MLARREERSRKKIIFQVGLRLNFRPVEYSDRATGNIVTVEPLVPRMLLRLQ